MAESSGRNIVLLSDGTGNSSRSLFQTNVRRVYEALDLADPKDPKHPRQFAYYDDGVGTSSFRPLALLGGAFGFGLSRNVRDLYAFLCRTYRPGDRIYAFGFSRGAFTVRVTVGLIVNQGIVAHDGDEATLERNVQAAWRAYRRERYGGRPLTVAWRVVRDAVIGAYETALGMTPFAEVPRHRIGEAGEGTIEFVGVWDTVDAYGLPIEELTRAVDVVLFPFTMPNGDLAKEVRRARHALSLDDQRNTFHPRLWNEKLEQDPDRIRQVWFAGVHADVGGGYPDAGLAHVTLEWMLAEAVAAVPGHEGLRFSEEIRARQRVLADENAPMHDSRAGLASYYRYKPRRLSSLAHQPTGLTRGYEVELRRVTVHESVLRRISVGQDGYAPISLPPSFLVQPVEAGAADTRKSEACLWDNQNPSEAENDFARQQEHVWNFVWWRRVAYFTTLIGTTFLAIMPLHKGVATCSSWACPLSPLLSAAEHVLPGFASTWTQVFASHPATTLAGIAVVLAGTVTGRHLDVRIPDEMRRLWYRTKLRPDRHSGMVAFAEPRDPGRLNSAVQTFRTSQVYSAFWDLAGRIVLPTTAFAFGALLLLGGLNAALLSAMESGEGVCGNSEVMTEGSTFRTSSLCHRVLDKAEMGGTYLIRVTIPARDPGPSKPPQDGCQPTSPAASAEWWDCQMPAGPNGIHRGAEEWWMPLAVPFRRHLGEPWHKLMARIGNNGSDVYAPDWRLAPDQGATTYRAQIRARRSGPIYLYVNDAAPVLRIGQFYGSNNWGTADVTVELLDREVPRHD
ncbi:MULTISPECIES: DUF2235 domain-containing protein [Roseomonadaceae]|uniref:DUF2235 domain-containing protein n=1 Tax=Falsiroseomonas oleicola TaxID=2801474 RepID=A0ABS6HBM4_9PROT|nr:DUF2235 domain-containing protein [Roseomonas oleicola]MBU8546140.1 DUF2235 domain-containing protein [Roseomonas oleicola]